MSQLNLDLDKKKQLEKLRDLVLGMNKKMNIISKNDEEIIWERHILDSLQVVNVVGDDIKGSLIDMGSGYGFPVIPLSIYYPEVSFTAVESRTKRTTIINYLKRELSLNNINVINDRVENIDTGIQYDYSTSRALGNIYEDVGRAIPLLKSGGSYLGYKTEECSADEFMGMKVKNFRYEQASSDKNYYIVSVTKQ